MSIIIHPNNEKTLYIDGETIPLDDDTFQTFAAMGILDLLGVTVHHEH